MSAETDNDIITALGRWFISQGIELDDAATIAARFTGNVVGTIVTDKMQLEKGIELLSNMLSSEAKLTFTAMIEMQRMGLLK